MRWSQDREVIFNLAGQVSHIDSMRDPYTDLEINCRAQLSMLEACRRHNPAVRVVFAGTRQVYGRPDRLPVDETHLVRPGRHQRRQQGGGRVLPPALQQRLRRARVLAAADQRLRPASADQAQPPGLHRLVHPARDRGREIQIFGDGSQLRDFVYVDDAADAFLRAGATDACDGEVFNVGGDEPISHRDLVALLIESPGAGSVRFVEWPPEKKRIDIGSFYSDSTKFREAVGWPPQVGLREGLRRTIAFYREHIGHYVDEPAARRRGKRAGDPVPAS